MESFKLKYNNFDKERYDSSVLLAILCFILQIGLVIYDKNHIITYTCTMSFTAILGFLGAYWKTKLQNMGYVVAYAASACFIIDICLECHLHHDLPKSFYMLYIIISIILFTWLKNRVAVLLSSLMLIFLSLLFSPNGDLLFPFYSAIAVIFLSFLSKYGKKIVIEKNYNKMLYDLAHTDSLTGLKNRRSIWYEIDKAYKAILEVKKELAIILVDIDKFKSINDTLGHEIGDLVLTQFANTLSDFSKNKPISVARWGGEEFLLIIDCAEKKKLDRWLNELQVKLDNIIFNSDKNQSIQITASYGVAFSSEADLPDNLIRLADERMYNNKHTKLKCRTKD